MTLTAGVLSQSAVTDTTASLVATAATGGTGPYTYQWYRSTTSGFSPGGGNIISGATALTLSDTGLIPNTTYYYKVIVTDTGNSNVTATYTQLAVVTSAQTMNPNQFAQTEYVGTIDLRFDGDTVSCQVDVSQATALYPGQPVKLVDSADGVPKVIAATAATDAVFGFINFDIKSVTFPASAACEVSMSGNVMYLYATAAIARGAQVMIDVTTVGGVKTATGGGTYVGWAYDKATAAGALIRIFIKTPSFVTVS
jgi:hypothetical protein